MGGGGGASPCLRPHVVLNRHARLTIEHHPHTTKGPVQSLKPPHTECVQLRERNHDIRLHTPS